MAGAKSYAVRVSTRHEMKWRQTPAAELPNGGPVDHYTGHIDIAGPDGRPRIDRRGNSNSRWALGTIVTPLIVRPPIERCDVECLRESEVGAEHVQSLTNLPGDEATLIELTLPENEALQLSPVAYRVMATLNSAHDGTHLVYGPVVHQG